MTNKINEKNNIVNHDNNSNQKKCRVKGFFDWSEYRDWETDRKSVV